MVTNMFRSIINKIERYSFLFEELVKRDFKQKYKRTVLGMFWSILSPLLNLFVMRLVFTQMFGRSMEHYTIYLFCGTLVFSYFKESTHTGMSSLMSNSSIFSKINIPKYMFLLSKNVSVFINFLLTLGVFFIFVAIDHVQFTWKFICLLYPIFCLVLLNIGIGLILSALFVFFRDISYLYDIFLTVLNYVSVIFYTLNGFSARIQRIFLINPVYCYIKYFRTIVLDGNIPSLNFHLLCLEYALVALFIGGYIYKKYNNRFLYYI